MTNRELLTSTSPEYLFTGIEKQKRYLLRIWVQQQPCPNCLTLHNVFEATCLDIDDPHLFDGETSLNGQCRSCGRTLHHVVPILSTEPYLWR